MARLFLVATPIGNLEDITLRALRVLKEARRVLAEDTRRTGVLLNHHGIRASLVSAYEGNEAARAEQAVGWLDAGEDVALVSDAGTPLLSDPGDRIVRAALAAGHDVVPVPGPSAVVAAISAAGLEAVPFTFFGFAPRSGEERRRVLGEVAESAHTTVLYEAPRRLVRLLRDLEERCGPDRPAVVAREVTKLYEEFRRGTLSEVRAYYEDAAPRGEIVVVVAGRPPPSAEEQTDAMRELVRELIGEGGRASGIAREVARRLGVPRNLAYDIVLSEMAGDG